MANTEVQRHTGVDVEDVPSAEWGWSKENPKFFHIGGIIAALFLLALMHGNHVGRVEDLFLIGFAVVILAAVARDWWLRRRGWIR
ncbi:MULTISPECIES: DUF2631 domain-containing protein [Mycobacteriaceae]|uniref:DUF2631 domain-containing protein n=1 Tax=unclassified Mycobacterium TaxID=2642494 RepID=UPI0007FE67F7|nr:MULTISPECIES: DUF2631 domain-containing protein [Mycobacteriaceae]OBB44056.1 hypothetical protein A5752_04615 [Mycobacterium sp. 852002-51961_SCH5331710]OBG88393.1 hypothetical protein A5698_24465 [Mycobacterium sp. E136]OBK80762.1 hypothetical protein A5650_04205 [Mycobacterium sp. 1164985.4]CRL77230.1 putative transmembrane protein [Mycolicibacterium komanii]